MTHHGPLLELGAKVAPPIVGLTVAWLIPALQVISLVLTIVYTALMIAEYIRKRRNEARDETDG